MIHRQAAAALRDKLADSPAVVLLGARQVGKTTLAHAMAAEWSALHGPAVVLDMERPADRAQLTEPELFLSRQRERFVVLDEVQHMPGLFGVLRPEIDADRRPGRFLLLGSTSGSLLRQSAESLAGRVSYLELPPLLAQEAVPAFDLRALQSLWLRGGFPLAWAARSDRASFSWRQDFIQTFLQRDLPQFGVGIPASTLLRFWRMLAHLQGQLLNASLLGMSLGGLAHTTVLRYLDLMVDVMMVRRLEPHAANVGKRLVKSPKIYVRDSGLLHALLNIATVDDLQAHPIAGPSWEGFVLEQIAAAAPANASLGFYRTAAGTEIDAVLQVGQRTTGFEVKFSSTPKVGKGFWQALDDLQLDRAFVVAPVERRYPLAAGVEVIPVDDLAAACRGD